MVMSGRYRRWRVVAPVVLLLCLAGWRAPHPMHLSMTEVVVDTRSARVTATIRLFGTDLAAATGRLSTVGHDSIAVRYVLERLRIRDDRARPISMTSCGVTRRADLVWVCTSATVGATRSIEMTNRVLLELYEDQVNIVQLRSGERRQSAMYRRGMETHQLRLR